MKILQNINFPGIQVAQNQHASEQTGIWAENASKRQGTLSELNMNVSTGNPFSSGDRQCAHSLLGQPTVNKRAQVQRLAGIRSSERVCGPGGSPRVENIDEKVLK